MKELDEWKAKCPGARRGTSNKFTNMAPSCGANAKSRLERRLSARQGRAAYFAAAADGALPGSFSLMRAERPLRSRR